MRQLGQEPGQGQNKSEGSSTALWLWRGRSGNFNGKRWKCWVTLFFPLSPFAMHSSCPLPPVSWGTAPHPELFRLHLIYRVNSAPPVIIHAFHTFNVLQTQHEVGLLIFRAEIATSLTNTHTDTHTHRSLSWLSPTTLTAHPHPYSFAPLPSPVF